MRKWRNLPNTLQFDTQMEDSGSTIKLTGSEKESARPVLSDGSKYGSIVQLSPSRAGNTSWWKKRNDRIFRKKTLLMRVPILQWLPKYSTNDFVADLIAGVTIGITVIPQALAYATIGGLPPEYGLYSAYVGCFVYVVLGSTRVVTIGPTALLGLLTHDGALLMGPQAAVLLAFLTGCISLLFGILNFGFLIEFIAAPVIAGFTTAAALTIGTTQVKSLLGLKFEADGFVETWKAVFEHIEETKTWDAVMGFSSVAALLLLRLLDRVKIGNEDDRTAFQRFINGTFWLISVSRNAIVIIFGCTIAAIFITPGDDDAPFELTGNITSGLPSIQAPSFNIEYGNQTFNFMEICQNLGSALFVTPLIAILESMAIAKSFAKGKRIDASQPLERATYWALLYHRFQYLDLSLALQSITLVAYELRILVLLAITILTPYFFFIPKSCLAAVIITAVIFMVEIHLVKLVWNSRKLDLIPLFVTFTFCLFLSLEIGIIIGTAVNLAMLLYATARPRIKILTFQNISAIDDQIDHINYLHITPDRSVVFTAIDYFMSTVRKASVLYPGVPVVIDLSYVSIADFSTAYVSISCACNLQIIRSLLSLTTDSHVKGFDNLAEDLHKRGHTLVITRAHPGVLTILEGVRGTKLHVHRDGIELDRMLLDLWSTSSIAKNDIQGIKSSTIQVPINSE
uniref:SLC26A/SulP transporter domain-containing protein n=1 Tax=Daphnia galeata TaxID=27404 RepID=A0A8J2RYW5_9CRUS|nr:unnamed protein product [Daphnia galeata]